MSVTNMMRILICCISLLSFMACNETSTKRILMDNDAVKNSPFVNTRPVPGLITSPRILGQKESQKCVLKDTFSVMNNALCKWERFAICNIGDKRVSFSLKYWINGICVLSSLTLSLIVALPMYRLCYIVRKRMVAKDIVFEHYGVIEKLNKSFVCSMSVIKYVIYL